MRLYERPVPILVAVSAVLVLLGAPPPPAGAAEAIRPTGPPRLSPMASVEQVVGLAEIGITYSRPSARGRSVWGGLVPWGEVWRTGANEASVVELSHDATVEGEPLRAGRYALFTIPRPDRWTLVFNREAEQWGAFSYDETQDVLRVDVEPEEGDFREMLTISVPETSDEAATVAIEWLETRVPFTVAFDTDSIAIARARELAEDVDSPQSARELWSWAGYFHRKGTHLDEALAWTESLLPGSDSYWNTALHARLLAADGREAEAAEVAARAIAQGKAALEESPNPRLAEDLAELEEEAAGWG